MAIQESNKILQYRHKTYDIKTYDIQAVIHHLLEGSFQFSFKTTQCLGSFAVLRTFVRDETQQVTATIGRCAKRKPLLLEKLASFYFFQQKTYTKAKIKNLEYCSLEHESYNMALSPTTPVNPSKTDW